LKALFINTDDLKNTRLQSYDKKKRVASLLRKAQAPCSAAYGLLEKANAFSSCDAYAAEAFLVERSN
jgi:hypothetical protein